MKLTLICLKCFSIFVGTYYMNTFRSYLLSCHGSFNTTQKQSVLSTLDQRNYFIYAVMEMLPAQQKCIKGQIGQLNDAV